MPKIWSVAQQVKKVTLTNGDIKISLRIEKTYLYSDPLFFQGITMNNIINIHMIGGR